MLVSDYNYQLPKEKIAKLPPKVRGEAKLLVYNRRLGELQDRIYADCVKYLNPGDVLVLNNTSVIKARLFAHDEKGVLHELILLERHAKDNQFKHKVLFRGQLAAGQVLTIKTWQIKVIKILEGGIADIESRVNLETITQKAGEVPLPPYLKRSATKADEVRYQTVFAKTKGSVAAPTASLNMTEDLLEQIKAKGVKVLYITLHVGLGTFLPIRSDNISAHQMHSEWYSIPGQTAKAIQNAKTGGYKITAVGTTVARTLEYAASDILKYQGSKSLTGEADIFIYPGYKFALVDQLLTNFHAPKSTVLMLAAAFCGWKNLETAYKYALKNKYRFLSYGDSMLII